MKSILALIVIISLSSCAAHQVRRTPEYTPSIPWYEPISEVPTSEPELLNPEFHRFKCSASMPYVLTLGIIPRFCHEHYQYEHDVYKVTTMTGWIPLIYPLFSNWRYGFGNIQEIRTEIERLAQPVDSGNG